VFPEVQARSFPFDLCLARNSLSTCFSKLRSFLVHRGCIFMVLQRKEHMFPTSMLIHNTDGKENIIPLERKIRKTTNFRGHLFKVTCFRKQRHWFQMYDYVKQKSNSLYLSSHGILMHRVWPALNLASFFFTNILLLFIFIFQKYFKKKLNKKITLNWFLVFLNCTNIKINF
jgi:hypothetical protein